MMKLVQKSRRVLGLLCLALGVSGTLAPRALAAAPDDAAKKLIEYGQNVAAKEGPGESFGWAVSFSEGQFVSEYRRTKDTAWLDAGVKVYDFVIGKMQPGPDGYKGFVGDFIYNQREATKYWTDCHVGDSILLAHMLEFAELVLKDPDLKNKYATAAEKYVAIAKLDLLEKWDKRGTWKEDGPYGCYVGWDMFCQPGDTSKWTEDPKLLLAEPAEPFNKNNHMGLCALRIYRITGEEKYRDRAMKIFSYMKSRFQLVDEGAFSYYVWNYWEPFGPESVDLAKHDTRHWMNVHGGRPYQAGEVPQIVEAYNTGVVFDKTDIERIINTNLKVMWNGDKAKPHFANSNWKLPMPPGADGKPPAPETNSPAGQLWTGLAQFSQEVRDLAGRNNSGGRPVTFERLYCGEKDAKVFNFPFHSCKSLTAAAVMPAHNIQKGHPTILMCKARVPQATFEVALYSADGTEKLLTIHQGKIDGGLDGHAGIFLLQWDPATVKDKALHGAYRIRWTGVDGYREFPITVAE